MATLIRATYPEPQLAVNEPLRRPTFTEEVFPANGKSFKLAEVQAFCGGYVEVLDLADGRIMIANEEGKIRGLPVNVEATFLFRQQRHSGEVVVGDVLVCKDSEFR